MNKTNREPEPITTVDDFDRKYFPEYFQKRQQQKDFEDSEKRVKEAEALMQVLFSIR